MQLQKNQESFISRATPENAQVVVSMLTLARPHSSTETRSLLLMLSPTPNFMHLYNFATYFIFLLEIKKCFVLQQGQSFSLPLKSSIFAS